MTPTTTNFKYSKKGWKEMKNKQGTAKKTINYLAEKEERLVTLERLYKQQYESIMKLQHLLTVKTNEVEDLLWCLRTVRIESRELQLKLKAMQTTDSITLLDKDAYI